MDRSARTLGERYELVEVVGRGGMGEVWAARDLRLDRRVAVKVLRTGVGFDDATRARFQREAQAAARLSHPNVVTVYDSGEHEGTPFLVMELLSGRSLADELAEGPLGPQRARDVGMGVLAGLGASHRAGVLHRDIKPANVLLAADGTARLADFGIAKSVEGADLTATGIVLGTAAYLAPERLAGHAATARSDLYAVGAVLYEALGGRKAFTADTPVAMLRAIEEHRPSPLVEQRPALDPALVAVVERALAKDPNDRFATAEEMADALGAPSGGNGHRASTAPTTSMTATAGVASTEVLTPVAAPTTTANVPGGMTSDPEPPGTAQAWWRQRSVVLLAAVVAVLVVLLTAVVVESSPSPDPDSPATTSDPAGTSSSPPEALDDAITDLEDTTAPSQAERKPKKDDEEQRGKPGEGKGKGGD